MAEFMMDEYEKFDDVSYVRWFLDVMFSDSFIPIIDVFIYIDRVRTLGIPSWPKISSLFTMGAYHSVWCIPRIFDHLDIGVFFVRHRFKHIGADFLIC